MKALNWNIFELNFDGQQQLAFERMAYALFCSKFNIQDGIFAYKNQIGIETEPFEDNGKWIGFQVKYVGPSVPLSSKKKEIIKSLKLAKERNSKLNEVYVYLSKAPGESKVKGSKSPTYILDIEAEAKELDLSIVWQVPSHLEKQLSNTENLLIAKEFFPELVEKESILNKTEELLDLNRTAIIQIEIAKIKFDFTYDWSKSKEILDKLFVYTDFRNETIARDILSFLNIDVSSAARSNMPSSIAISIEGLVLTYFPSSYGEPDREMRIENGKECIYIGLNLAYDSLIHTNNFEVAQWGLTIWKFVYRESKRNKMSELVEAVLKQYTELEQTLERPERNDLGNARELVKIFKEDLDTYDLSFPVLPPSLYNLVEKCD